jgi:hypothetical protein
MQCGAREARGQAADFVEASARWNRSKAKQLRRTLAFGCFDPRVEPLVERLRLASAARDGSENFDIERAERMGRHDDREKCNGEARAVTRNDMQRRRCFVRVAGGSNRRRQRYPRLRIAVDYVPW